MDIAPSSDHPLLTLKLPFKVMQRRFEVFWCLEWESKSTNKNYYGINSFKIYNTFPIDPSLSMHLWLVMNM